MKKRGPYKKKKDLFPIETGIVKTNNTVSNHVVTKAINSIYQLKNQSDQSFLIPNNKENGVQPQSIPQILRERLRKQKSNVAITTSLTGPKKNPTGIRIWRIN